MFYVMSHLTAAAVEWLWSVELIIELCGDSRLAPTSQRKIINSFSLTNFFTHLQWTIFKLRNIRCIRSFAIVTESYRGERRLGRALCENIKNSSTFEKLSSHSTVTCDFLEALSGKCQKHLRQQYKHFETPGNITQNYL